MFTFSLKSQNKEFYVDLTQGKSLAIPVSPLNGPVAYGLQKPLFTPFRSGDFVTSISEGGALNCESLSFYPHGAGTHTESFLHINNNGLPMSEMVIPPFLNAILLSIKPTLLNGDWVVNELPFDLPPNTEAVIIRTLPNELTKLNENYSDTNPPYFTPNFMLQLVNAGIKHLLTDLPSVDKEVDGGKLLAHKQFFNQRLDATITELIFAPNDIDDGIYALNLQVPKIFTDAVPSNPIIFPLLLR
jgi:kynurenine formamidase